MADILCDTRNSQKNYPKVVIVTHGDADGLVAALIVKAFEELIEKKSFLIMSSMSVETDVTDSIFTYICNYTDLGKRDKVYILDRGIPSINWLKMCYLCDTNIINIDHHITNEPRQFSKETCCQNIEFIWSDKKSAALLTLEYFQKFLNNGEQFKKLYEKLEDLAVATSCWDIFTWKNLGNSKEDLILKNRALSINAAEKIMGSLSFYNILEKNLQKDTFYTDTFYFFDKLNEIYNFKKEYIYNYAKRVCFESYYHGEKILVVYGVDIDYQSIIADTFFNDKKYSNINIIALLTIFGTVSFRSRGEKDVSELARKMGDFLGYSGGGHKNAAGCKLIDRDKIKDKIINTFNDALAKI